MATKRLGDITILPDRRFQELLDRVVGESAKPSFTFAQIWEQHANDLRNMEAMIREQVVNPPLGAPMGKKARRARERFADLADT